MACCGWGSAVRQPPGLPWQWITPWAASSLDASGQAESTLFEYTVAEIQQKLISCYYLLGTVLGTGHWGDGTEMKFAPIFYLFLFIFIFLIFKIFIVIQLQLSAFSPHPYPTPAKPTSLPCLHPPPWFYPCVLYNSSCKLLSPLSASHSPLAIRLFLTSMSLVMSCLLSSLVYYVPVKGEVIWYLSLTAWLISLSIMLSSSIHAVAKGISSFFLSAA